MHKLESLTEIGIFTAYHELTPTFSDHITFDHILTLFCTCQSSMKLLRDDSVQLSFIVMVTYSLEQSDQLARH